MAEKISDWLTGLGDKPKVTVYLRSGREVTGTIVAQIPTNTRDATAFRIKRESEEGVLVSVKEIEQIHIH